MYRELADEACERIAAAILRAGIRSAGDKVTQVLLDPYNPMGSTSFVNFTTSKNSLYRTDSRKCQVNWVVLDSDWEAEFCRVVESHPRVLAYVKNHNIGFEVPYRFQSQNRKYLPDFIVLVDDGNGPTNPLHLIVEIKGLRAEDAKAKKQTMDTYWIPGVNRLGNCGRWAFAEFTDVWELEDDFAGKIKENLDALISQVAKPI